MREGWEGCPGWWRGHGACGLCLLLLCLLKGGLGLPSPCLLELVGDETYSPARLPLDPLKDLHNLIMEDHITIIIRDRCGDEVGDGLDVRLGG